MVTLPELQAYLDRWLTEKAPDKKVTIYILHKGNKWFSTYWGGWAIVHLNEILLMDWQLVDDEQSYSSVRHELAHFLKFWRKLPGTAHGSSFKGILRELNPNNWQRDRSWIMSSAISRVIPRKGKQKILKVYVCTKCKWQYSRYRVPKVVTQGQARCPLCQSNIKRKK